MTTWTPLPAERVEHDRERRRERLALAGLHLRDRAIVQHHPADQLDVEVAHAHPTAPGFADDREALGEQIVERLPAACPLAQRVEALAQLVIRIELELGLEGVDLTDAALDRGETAYPRRR